MITSLPHSLQISSIHLEVFKKDCLPKEKMCLKSLGNLLNIENSINQFKNIRCKTIKLLSEQPHKFDMSYYTCQEKKRTLIWSIAFVQDATINFNHFLGCMNRTRICKWIIETPKYKKSFHSIKRNESKNILATSYTMTATEESLI